MVQHLLLTIVVAPLILGAPSVILLHGLLSRFVRDALGPVMRSR
jgi:cytochrome c oxidase assembly factor CtaG